MHRNISAALVALICLLSAPLAFAARPTRPAHPAPRFTTAEPHLRLRATRDRAQRRPVRAASREQVGRRSARVASHSQSAAHGIPVAYRSRRTRRSASQDDSSFVARSAKAAEERRAPSEASETDAAELRTNLDQMDFGGGLLPASRSFSLYNDRGRLIVPPPMRGSREVLLHQNEMADTEGLARIQDDADLDHLRSAKLLVPLPASDALHVDERLPDDRRYSRPWTAVFLAAMSRDFYASFHMPLQVDSAVRTVAVQQRLERTNGNAAPAEGETASPHLTGQAVDIAKRGLTLAEIAWLRLYLQPLMDAGKIDVEEEFRQACFHISVYKSYMPAPRLSVAAAATQPGMEP